MHDLSAPVFLMLLLLGGVATVPAHADARHSERDADYRRGEALYDARCSVCHEGAALEAPKTQALALYSPAAIVDSLETGVMSTIGMTLSAAEKRSVAYFLSGEPMQSTSFDMSEAFCDKQLSKAIAREPLWNGWGQGLRNQRFQAGETQLASSTVGGLRLKWAFAFPGATRARSQPLIAAGRLYVASQDGAVYALDAGSGCIYWRIEVESEVRGALFLLRGDAGEPDRLLFGDFKANVYAVNALTGALLWRERVHDHPLATITGSVVAFKDSVYVPVSSSEVIPAAQPDYPCCTFRGAVAALSTVDGKLRWMTYTTPEPVRQGRNTAGAAKYGPSGAPVWASPTLDPARGLLYASTGQNYSSPATDTSDAVIAMRLDDGAVAWVRQFTAGDAWNGGCSRGTINCPREDGPDFDVGTSVMRIDAESGKSLLVVGQKSGVVHAMDADGRIAWQTRVGKGGIMGGVHWGLSTDGEQVFAGVSDHGNHPAARGAPQPGVHAIDATTGEIRWRQVLPDRCRANEPFGCYQGVSAAVSSSPGLVYAGGLDGILRIYDARDGKILWEYATAREFDTVNAAPGRGGAIEADGVVIANGHLYVNSGYDKWGEIPGNVLLAFSLDGK